MSDLKQTLIGRSLIIFDLDGTLIDSAPDIQAALNQVLAQHGRGTVPLDECRQMIGDGSARLMERAFAARPGPQVDLKKALAEFLRLYEAESTTLTTFYPGVRETLEQLHAAGITLALCTNKPDNVTKAVLKSLDLDRFFDMVVTGDAQPYHKPDPRMVRPIFETLGIAAENAIYIGDSEVDAATAHAAAVDFVLMTYGYLRQPLESLTLAASLDHFGEIPGLIGVAKGADK